MVYKNCQFDSLSPLFLSCQAAGQPTTLWRSTDKHKVQRKNPPIPVLTWLSANHVLRSVSESLHLLQFDNHSRFIMWPKCGKKKNLHMCVIWCMSEIWIWLVLMPPQTVFHHAAARKRLLWGGSHVEKKTHLQMLQTQVDYVDALYCLNEHTKTNKVFKNVNYCQYIISLFIV